MSKLLAYNLTGAPLTLAAGNPTVPDLPASAAPPARGPAVNVTAELDGLSAGDYTALQVQVDAGDVQFVWDGTPNYDTGDLEAESPLTGAGGVAGGDIIYRRDAASPPSGVYASWATAHAAAVAAVAAGQGPVRILCDRAESTFLNQVGQPACDIPAGVWDMTDISLYGYGDSSDITQWVSLLEGALLDNLGSFGSYRGSFTILNEAQTTGGIRTSGTVRIEDGCQLYAPVASNLPILQNQGFTNLLITMGARVFIGLSSKLTPVIDIAGGDFILSWHGGGFIRDNSVEDSVGGGVFDVQVSAQGNGELAGSANWDQPGLAGAVLFGDIKLHRPRWTQLLSPIGFGDSPYDATDGGIRNIYDIDSSGGPVVFGMPRCIPMAGANVWVKDISGDAGTNTITINCSGADTFDDGTTSKTITVAFGVLHFVSDGFGVWRVFLAKGAEGNEGIVYAQGATDPKSNVESVFETALKRVHKHSVPRLHWDDTDGPVYAGAYPNPSTVCEIPKGAEVSASVSFVADRGDGVSEIQGADFAAAGFEVGDYVAVRDATVNGIDQDWIQVLEILDMANGAGVQSIIPLGFVSGGFTYTADNGGGNSEITDLGTDFSTVKAGMLITIAGSPTNDGTYEALTDGAPGTLTLVGVVLSSEGPAFGSLSASALANEAAVASRVTEVWNFFGVENMNVRRTTDVRQDVLVKAGALCVGLNHISNGSGGPPFNWYNEGTEAFCLLPNNSFDIITLAVSDGGNVSVIAPDASSGPMWAFGQNAGAFFALGGNSSGLGGSTGENLPPRTSKAPIIQFPSISHNGGLDFLIIGGGKLPGNILSGEGAVKYKINVGPIDSQYSPENQPNFINAYDLAGFGKHEIFIPGGHARNRQTPGKIHSGNNLTFFAAGAGSNPFGLPEIQTDGDFFADGFFGGEGIRVVGSASNDGKYGVAFVLAPTVMVLLPPDGTLGLTDLVAEGPVAADVQVAIEPGMTVTSMVDGETYYVESAFNRVGETIRFKTGTTPLVTGITLSGLPAAQSPTGAQENIEGAPTLTLAIGNTRAEIESEGLSWMAMGQSA